jgi:dTDP-4-dehydrorhamnose reductase
VGEAGALTGPHLLLGGGGLVGTHLRSALQGRRLIATWHRTAFADGIPLDLRDAEAVRALIRSARPGVILLAAAEAHVERCEIEPDATRRVNVDATRVVVEAAVACDALVVAFSSDYVFDGSAGPYPEHAPLAPLNEYGRQKIALEEAVRAAPRHLICRTSGVFGWEPLRRNFVCQLVEALRGGRRFAVPTDQLITPTYAPDLAAAVIALCDGGTTGVIHAAGPVTLARADFARRVARAFQLPEALLDPRPTAALGLRARRPARAGLLTHRLRNVLGERMRAPEVAIDDMRDREPAQSELGSHE